MKKFFARHKILTVVTLVILVFVSYVGLRLLTHSITHSFDYHKVNEADMLNVYHDGNLVASIEDPSDSLGVVEAIGITSPKNLGLSRSKMKELYALEYTSDGETLCKISVLTPRDGETLAALEEKGKLSEWVRPNGECVIMRDGFCYFTLGNNYFTNLFEAIAA